MSPGLRFRSRWAAFATHGGGVAGKPPVSRRSRAAARESFARLAAVSTLAVLLAGCIDVGRPASCEGPAEIGLTLTAEALTPNDPAVCRGQPITLSVESGVDGVIHIHGYDDVVPATTVVAGETLELTFTASRSGQFPIELHPERDPRGVDVGILTVHEP